MVKDIGDIKYWLQVYTNMRQEGRFPQADELREMLRRMGYEIRTSKNKVISIK